MFGLDNAHRLKFVEGGMEVGEDMFEQCAITLSYLIYFRCHAR